MYNNKTSFKLHVALIQNQDEKTAQEAAFLAWLEGPRGLASRLGTLDKYQEWVDASLVQMKLDLSTEEPQEKPSQEENAEPKKPSK